MVIDSAEVSQWIELLLVRDASEHGASYYLALMQCARRVQDRYRDIDAGLRERVVARLRALRAPEHYITLVEVGGQLAQKKPRRSLVSPLPLGLTI